MKKFKKLIMFISIFNILILTISGCGKTEATNSDIKSDATSKKLSSLKVAWFPATIKAALTSVAYEEGYFKDEGLDVEVEVLQNASDAITALTLGKVDVVPVGITQQIQFISQGENVVIFGGSAQEGGAIITKPENKDKFADLSNWSGAVWATGRSFTGDFVVRDGLRKLNIIPEQDVKITDLGDNTPIIQAVSKGTADVGYITSDGVQIAENMGLSVGIKVGDIDPYYPCCRQSTNKETLENKHDELVAYTRALIRSYKLIQNDHEKVIDDLVKLSGQSKEYVETGLYGDYASKYNPDPAAKKILKFAGYLKQENVVKDSNIDSGIDTSIYNDALNQILEKYPDDPDYKALAKFYEENQ